MLMIDQRVSISCQTTIW